MEKLIFYLTIAITIMIIVSLCNKRIRILRNVGAGYSHSSELQTIFRVSVWNPSNQAKNSAIGFLFNDQVHILASKIQALDTNLLDNKTADIVIFHTGYPFQAHMRAVANVTSRRVIFLNVDKYFVSFLLMDLIHIVKSLRGQNEENGTTIICVDFGSR